MGNFRMPCRLVAALAVWVVSSMWLAVPLQAADLDKGLAAAKAEDYETALKELRPLAEAGAPVAQNALGVFYTHGYGVLPDPEQGVKWFQRSADGGYASAQYNLGLAYERGRGIAQDFDEAERWYLLAAAQGRTSAMLALGNLQLRGNGTWDTDAAADWFLKAAAAGDVEGLFRLGDMHLGYAGAPRNDREALKWLLQAADKGHDAAQTRIDRLYTDAEIAASQGDFDKAFEIWEPLAEHGDPDARFNLGLMYENGDGVARDIDKAVFLYTASADQGFARSQLRLGTIFMLGRIVDRNDTEAVRLFQRAARQGEAGAAINLATMYALGRGIDKNLVFANAWYLIAAGLDESLKSSADVGMQESEPLMSPSDLEEARRLADRCIETGLVDCPGLDVAGAPAYPQAGQSAPQPLAGPGDVETLLRSGQPEAALDLVREMRLKDPDDEDLRRLEARAYLTLGLDARKAGRDDQALDFYTRAIETSGGQYTVALNNRAAVHALRGDLEQALNDIAAALALDPDNSLYLANRCLFHRLGGRLERALEDCDRAASVELPSSLPNRAWVFLQRGMVLRMTGAVEASIPDFLQGVGYAKEQTVRRIQEMMTAAGLFDGSIDGRVGARLEAALETCIRDDVCFEAASHQISDIVEFME